MRFLLLLLSIPLPMLAQESPLFPRASVRGGLSSGSFRTTARIDPETAGEEGTWIEFERDLGLDDARRLRRFEAEWRPFRRHELEATYFSARRSGIAQIDRDITFRNQTYPVNAMVTTRFDLDYASLTYTFWARRSDHDGIGITLGAATLAIDASIRAESGGASATLEQKADTDLPVALAGLQSRVAITPRLHLLANAATLPHVSIGDYSGDAVTAAAQLEYRPLNRLGIGAADHYFPLNV